MYQTTPLVPLTMRLFQPQFFEIFALNHGGEGVVTLCGCFAIHILENGNHEIRMCDPLFYNERGLQPQNFEIDFGTTKRKGYKVALPSIPHKPTPRVPYFFFNSWKSLQL